MRWTERRTGGPVTARHKRGRRVTLPHVTGYRLERKAADWPDPAAPEGAVADPTDPNAPTWAGDLYTDGEPTDPVTAFAAFTGEEGQTAWLDVSPDGTITGWVQDGEEVFRYTDPQAWAQDVDGAAMSRAGELSEPVEGEEGPEGEAVEGEEDLAEDPDADGDAEGGDIDGDGDGEPLPDGDELEEKDGEDVELDDSTGHDPNGDTPAVPGDGVAPENEGDPAEPEHDENMDPEDDNFYTRMKKKGEKKSLAFRVQVAE